MWNERKENVVQRNFYGKVIINYFGASRMKYHWLSSFVSQKRHIDQSACTCFSKVNLEKNEIINQNIYTKDIP